MKFHKSETFTQTYTGKIFHFMDPHLDEICIEDIAHALALQCRYNGHVNEFYSVAQHCCCMAMIVEERVRKQALLHDAPEAYIGDMSKPLKVRMGEFRKVEATVWRAIAVKFNIPVELDPLIKEADIRMLATERRDLMRPPPCPWVIDRLKIEPYKGVICPWSPQRSEQTFLAMFYEI